MAKGKERPTAAAKSGARDRLELAVLALSEVSKAA